MADGAFEDHLPEELRRIADALAANRDVADGHLLERVERRVASSTGRAPRRWRGRPRTVWIALALLIGGLNVSGVFATVGLGPSSVTGLNLAQVISSVTRASSTGSNSLSAADAVYCQDGTSGACTCPNPPKGYPNLGGSSGFTVFALDGGTTQTVVFSNDTINGNVGVAAGAAVANNAPSTINGNVYVDSGGHFTGPGKVNGTVYTNQNLSSDRTAAINASASAALLPANFTYTNITSNTTVNGTHGLNVVDITGNINLNNASLTLSGPADAFFVVNVAGSITLVGTGGIVVGGSAPASQLFINMTGTGNSLLNTQVGNLIQGTLDGPHVGGSLDGAFGSLLLGGNFSLLSGVQVTYGGCQ